MTENPGVKKVVEEWLADWKAREVKVVREMKGRNGSNG